VAIAVEPEGAQALRTWIGAPWSDASSAGGGHNPLAAVIRRINTRAHAAGLTDEMVDAELAAAKAARRPR